MRYTLANGKIITISDAEIENSMKHLDLSREEAIQMWLEDHDYEVNEEQEELDEKAKQVKIKLGAQSETPRKKSEKPKTVKVSDEKHELFEKVLDNLKETDYNVAILKENKLIEVKIGEKTFKIDIIEQRPPK